MTSGRAFAAVGYSLSATKSRQHAFHDFLTGMIRWMLSGAAQQRLVDSLGRCVGFLCLYVPLELLDFVVFREGKESFVNVAFV
jgi:hypothetical protein